MFTAGRLPFIDSLLSDPPPRHLFHYTNPRGLEGICRSKQLWAGRAADLNDASEQVLAVELAQLAIRNWLNFRQPPPELARLLKRMHDGVHDTNRQIYVAALSAHRDVLSQWRAYCPRSGGAALGLPADHLRVAAHDQGFFLARCLYDHTEQQRLINELLTHHVAVYVEGRVAGNGSTDAALANSAVHGLAADLAQFGPLIKHRSFLEEGEWRLVSAPSDIDDPRLLLEPQSTRLRVYLSFELLTSSHPTFPIGPPDEHGPVGPGVVVGPNVDSAAAQQVVQMLLRKYFGPDCWHSVTDSPYR